MRDAFVKTLTALMRGKTNLVVLTADMGFSVFENIQREFPDRFFNTGVTEQSSLGIAAGFALSGYKVLFYAQASFATMRCFEQLRLDAAYGNLDIKIVGSSCGFSLNQLGISHYSLEDIALMRTLPLHIFCPGDPWEVEILTKEALKISGPVYIRIGKQGDSIIHSIPFKAGQGIEVRQGDRLTLISTGNMLSVAAHVASRLKGARLISMPTIKPIDADIISKATRETGAIFTIEEHLITGGLGDAVAEVFLEENRYPQVFHKFGVRHVVTDKSGSHDYLRRIHGLSSNFIVKKICALWNT